ncbi:hypothetical protein ABT187_23470 [Streptomyces sp. NPDC001817]|uniref:hypothetical protein n=1 Tax=Streptomyces sp. NPDC001817 TaxID=3154398 RepID=UPI00332C76F6
MTTTEAAGLTLPQCCAHLTSWDDGVSTALAHVAAVPAGFPAGTRAPESVAVAEPAVVRLSESRTVGA